MSVNINLTLKQIYEQLCDRCKKQILDLVAEEGAKAAVREDLLRQLEGKEES